MDLSDGVHQPAPSLFLFLFTISSRIEGIFKKVSDNNNSVYHPELLL